MAKLCQSTHSLADPHRNPQKSARFLWTIRPLIHSPHKLSTPTPNSSTRTSEPLPACHRTVTSVTHTRQLMTVTAGEESGEAQRNRDRRQSGTAFMGRRRGDYGDCVGATWGWMCRGADTACGAGVSAPRGGRQVTTVPTASRLPGGNRAVGETIIALRRRHVSTEVQQHVLNATQAASAGFRR